ncbi:hypothetical protein LP420_29085 [Massilia sp. B-10]|nr:hypothetical protein LP420_29085 [Massilia sp. B-10]
MVVVLLSDAAAATVASARPIETIAPTDRLTDGAAATAGAGAGAKRRHRSRLCECLATDQSHNCQYGERFFHIVDPLV